MKKSISWMLFAVLVQLMLYLQVYGSEPENDYKSDSQKTAFHPQPYSSSNDIAFVSVWGSRPDVSRLRGFQRAVLYNARGEVVQKVDMRSDSIYSLDRMIHENRARGPLFIRMYK